MSNNKGSTWASKLRTLNKSASAYAWHAQVAKMTVDDLDQLAVDLEKALVVLEERAPDALEKGRVLMAQFADEDNFPAAVMLVRGTVLLAAMLNVEARA